MSDSSAERSADGGSTGMRWVESKRGWVSCLESVCASDILILFIQREKEEQSPAVVLLTPTSPAQPSSCSPRPRLRRLSSNHHHLSIMSTSNDALDWSYFLSTRALQWKPSAVSPPLPSPLPAVRALPTRRPAVRAMSTVKLIRRMLLVADPRTVPAREASRDDQLPRQVAPPLRARRRRRVPSPSSPLLTPPSFTAGKPNPYTFPFSKLEVSLKPIIPSDPVETLAIDGAALNEGLQYAQTSGLPGVVEFLEDLTEKRHGRERDGSWRVSVGSGSQDLITKVSSAAMVGVGVGGVADARGWQAFHALLNEGDSLLIESPVYS